MTTLYRARWVLPITAPAIPDGAIAVDGNGIVAVGSSASLAHEFAGATIHDLGEAAIIPGLINTHSHLELTAMRGFLEDEEPDFFAWLKKLTVARLEQLTADDLSVSAAWGACEAARAGVTCVADASDSALESMNALRDGPAWGGVSGIVRPRRGQTELKNSKQKLRACANVGQPGQVRRVATRHTVCAPAKLISVLRWTRLALDDARGGNRHGISFLRDGSDLSQPGCAAAASVARARRFAYPILRMEFWKRARCWRTAFRLMTPTSRRCNRLTRAWRTVPSQTQNSATA